jgi:hypothetical protein
MAYPGWKQHRRLFFRRIRGKGVEIAGLKSALTNYCHGDFSRMGCCPVLPQINALPRPEPAAPVDYRQRQRCLRQYRPNMRGHVISAFCGMQKGRIAIWHQSRHEALEIVANVGVRIFADYQRRARMLNKNMTQTSIDIRVPDESNNFIGNVQNAAPGGLYFQRMLKDHKQFIRTQWIRHNYR